MIQCAFNTKVAFSPVTRGGGLMFVCLCTEELAQKNVVELKEEEIKTDSEGQEVDGEEKEERSREKGVGGGGVRA